MGKKQEAFTKIVQHLRKQGAKAVSEDNEHCLYRAPNGNKCAVGCLIDDELYEICLEGQALDNPEVSDALEESGWANVDDTFLSSMQIVHDNYEPEEWEEHFTSIAVQHKLTVPSKETQ